MMYAIDLNCDLGESFGAYHIGMDDAVIPFISSANVACGFHAADPLVMEKTVALCKENQVQVGAHPGYPDLVGFGRRNLNVAPAELKAMVMYQVGALDAFCRAKGLSMQHVKPHGAMYNMAGKDLALASAICEAIYEVNPSLILMALSGSKMTEAAEKYDWKEIEVVHMVAMGKAGYCAPEMSAHFRHNALFVGGSTRKAVEEGGADFTPVFFFSE